MDPHNITSRRSWHQQKSMFLVQALVIVLGLVTHGCGKEVKKLNRNGLWEKKVALQVTGPLVELSGQGETSRRSHKITTRLLDEKLANTSLALAPTEPTSREESGESGPTVKLRLVAKDGTLIWEQSKTGVVADWDINLPPEEGLYTLSATVGASESLGYDEIKPWLKAVTLDMTPPALTLSSILRQVANDGKRTLDVQAVVAGETSVTCEESEVDLLGKGRKTTLALVQATSQVNQQTTLFQGKLVLDPSDVKSLPLVRLTCSDKAGNQVEITQPAQTESRQVSIQAQAIGPVDDYLSARGKVKVTYLRTSEVAVKVLLLDAKAGGLLPEAVSSFYSGQARIYVSDGAPNSLEDLVGTKRNFWIEPYKPDLTVKLPIDRLDYQDLSLSLVQRDSVTGKEELINTVKVPVVVDTIGPEVEFVSAPNLVAPVKGTPIQFSATVKFDAAPLAKDPEILMSTDNKTWQTTPATVVKTPDGPYTFRVPYPLQKEEDLRLRIRAIDRAGNEGLSPISDLVVRRAETTFAVTPAERSACQSSGAPAAKLTPWLVSSFLCRKSDSKGSLSATPYGRILMQNRGQVAPQFYSTAFIAPGFSYQVKINGVKDDAAAGRFEPPQNFSLGPDDIYTFNLQLSNEWLTADKVEIFFDAEPTDTRSTINSCYPDEKPFPSVTLVDRANGLVPIVSAFPCGKD